MSWIFFSSAAGTMDTADLTGLTSLDMIDKMQDISEFTCVFAISDSKGLVRYVGAGTEVSNAPLVVAQCFMGLASITWREKATA